MVYSDRPGPSKFFPIFTVFFYLTFIGIGGFWPTTELESTPSLVRALLNLTLIGGELETNPKFTTEKFITLEITAFRYPG